MKKTMFAIFLFILVISPVFAEEQIDLIKKEDNVNINLSENMTVLDKALIPPPISEEENAILVKAYNDRKQAEALQAQADNLQTQYGSNADNTELINKMTLLENRINLLEKMNIIIFASLALLIMFNSYILYRRIQHRKQLREDALIQKLTTKKKKD